MKLESVYHRLPVIAQNFVCSVYGLREGAIRYGRPFREKYAWLLKTESANRQQINDYQDIQVRQLIRHAFNTVPYYRRVMAQRGLTPDDIQTRADLAKLPVLTKEDVIKYFHELKSTTHADSRVIARKTSGTTGTALKFMTSVDAVAFQWAVWCRHRSRFGVVPGDLSLNFTGKLVVAPSQPEPPFWRWNWPMRQALVNMQHMSSSKIDSIARFADSHPFKFYSGYPSIICAFASLLEESGIVLRNRPSHVFLGAEKVHKYQKELIERVLGATVSDQYGFSEGCGNASRCEHGPYHEDWEFGVLEIDEPIIAGDGSVTGGILATGFANLAFPFIRYAVGDVAVIEPEDYRCSCGRSSRVLRNVEGRDEDYVLTPEGLRVMRFDYLFKDTVGIREAQVIQRKLGEIVIRYVLRDGSVDISHPDFRARVKEWISPTLSVVFERVMVIPRGANGKFRPVLSELSRRDGSVRSAGPQSTRAE